MDIDLRCDSKKHALLLVDDHTVEIKCNSRFCGHRRGTVVLHRFDLASGQLVKTLRFAEPEEGKQ